MSSSSEFNIDHLAKLARLALTPEEKAVYSEQLGHVLHHIAELGKVDVTGVDPTAHAFAVSNVWQEDVARPGLTVDDALRNAPAKRDNMIVVPKVVE
jgi:aspartyl-tRNA(Asn)/glutamyl-tRNA(Gln) amidotransferase subunit C